MRRYLTALAVALVALSGAARVWSQAAQQSTLPVVISYDVDSTSFVYPIALGPTAVPSTVIRPQAAEGWYVPTEQPASATVNPKIKTATYSASVVSCVASSSSMAPKGHSSVHRLQAVHLMSMGSGNVTSQARGWTATPRATWSMACMALNAAPAASSWASAIFMGWCTPPAA